MITKTMLEEVKQDILDAIKEVEKKHNVAISFRGGSYTDTDATLKLFIEDNSNEASEENLRIFKTTCSYYNIPVDSLHKEITIDNKKFTFEGFNCSKRKNFVMIKMISNGAMYNTDVRTLLNALGENK